METHFEVHPLLVQGAPTGCLLCARPPTPTPGASGSEVRPEEEAMGLSLQVHRRAGGSTCAEALAVPLAVGSGPLGGQGGLRVPPVPGLTHLPWDPGSS